MDNRHPVFRSWSPTSIFFCSVCCSCSMFDEHCRRSAWFVFALDSSGYGPLRDPVVAHSSPVGELLRCFRPSILFPNRLDVIGNGLHDALLIGHHLEAAETQVISVVARRLDGRAHFDLVAFLHVWVPDHGRAAQS